MFLRKLDEDIQKLKIETLDATQMQLRLLLYAILIQFRSTDQELDRQIKN